jgi:hypothetical protein
MRVEVDTFVRAMSWLIRAGLSFSITDILSRHCVFANKKILYESNNTISPFMESANVYRALFS